MTVLHRAQGKGSGTVLPGARSKAAPAGATPRRDPQGAAKPVKPYRGATPIYPSDPTKKSVQR